MALFDMLFSIYADTEKAEMRVDKYIVSIQGWLTSIDPSDFLSEISEREDLVDIVTKAFSIIENDRYKKFRSDFRGVLLDILRAIDRKSAFQLLLKKFEEGGDLPYGFFDNVPYLKHLDDESAQKLLDYMLKGNDYTTEKWKVATALLSSGRDKELPELIKWIHNLDPDPKYCVLDDMASFPLSEARWNFLKTVISLNTKEFSDIYYQVQIANRLVNSQPLEKYSKDKWFDLNEYNAMLTRLALRACEIGDQKRWIDKDKKFYVGHNVVEDNIHIIEKCGTKDSIPDIEKLEKNRPDLTEAIQKVIQQLQAK
jgi:hypothetical protein